ncbi:MAG: tyrosine--tRNA ligase [Chloroflexi bacterium]|nr:tyrosine--tRNA ligase [Chloroflexota bacterium]
MTTLDEKALHRLLRRGVAEIVVEEELVRLLKEGRPLRLKMGFDPSRPDLHLGHVVGLRKLRQFQELGHQVILIVGDWTAQIGDPSGTSATRTMLSAEEVRANAQTYMRQFFKVVDRERTETRWQSEWFGKFDLSKVIELTSRFTVAQFLAREDFSQRFQAGRPIAITELLYPLLQAYDSLEIEADVEFGGTDQKFNLLVGRELQEKAGQRPQQCFLVPIIPGTDGVQKMSKTLHNYIAGEEPPTEMFGKVMSLPDWLIMDYFDLLTDVPDKELAQMRSQLAGGSGNPMELKKRLGCEIVAQFHSAEAARSAQEHFERVVQRRQAPEEMEAVAISANAPGVVEYRPGEGAMVEMDRFLALRGLASSRAEARRLLSQGAVQINGQKVTPDSLFVQIEIGGGGGVRKATQGIYFVPFGAVLRVGRHRFARVVAGQ